MQNMIPLHLRTVARGLLPAAPALAVALLLSACGGDASPVAGADSSGGGASSDAPARFDPSLRDAPCSVVSAETFSGVFGMPAAEIEQHGAMGMCLYKWKEGNRILDATVHVIRVGETVAEAREHFTSATAGMDGAELDAAMDAVREQARGQADGRDGEAGAVLGAVQDASSSGSGELQFRDVPGIGDRARMQAGRGDLNVLVGNLYFSVTAYHGDRMPAPASLQQIVAAGQAWEREILPQREEQTIALARAAVAAL